MQPKKALKTRRKYDVDFKTEVLKMLDSGQTATYVANALGTSENLIYRWKSLNQVGKKVVAGQSELTVENPGGEPQQLKDRVRQVDLD